MSERRTETSRALSEVRTVLSRAQTALESLERGPSEYHGEYVDKADGNGREWSVTRYEDPDQAEMIEALRTAVVALDRWRGARPRRAR